MLELRRHLAELVLGMECQVFPPWQAGPLRVLGRLSEFVPELGRNGETLFGVDHPFGLTQETWCGQV